MQRVPALLMAILALTCIGAAKKKPETTIRFHSETSRSDSETFESGVTLKSKPRQVFISKVPDISERDVTAIYPFQAQDGTWGCAFQLNRHGAFALETMSTDKRGRFVLAIVNARHVSDMLIDRRITDGIITIPNGLTEADIAALRQAFPVIGEEAKQK